MFWSADVALEFKMRKTSAGRLVLVEHLTGCVLEAETQGQTSLSKFIFGRVTVVAVVHCVQGRLVCSESYNAGITEEGPFS